ncbi:transcriptional repressor general negative regulator of transcription subunit 4 [Kappamyces sp. JEL0829]|nr:transcriptional repressor general negative regulator of transcription subunit 4 [Kappamyces sp. JEL0829]
MQASDYSDDEDNDCPLCLEEIEVDDKYFKPCPCGYQICRFCWNHIKNDLNGLCPACRRPYSDDAIEFRPVPPEEFVDAALTLQVFPERALLTSRLVRIKNAKKRKEREKKEQEVAAKKQLSNVRVVQKNLVYVLGLPLKLANEETLRSPDYFGQYGKITKVVVNRRNPAVGPNTHSSSPSTSNTGVYITFAKKEDAAKAIEAVDGTNYEGKIIRATFGTTKYCSYFLKGQNCQNIGCQFLHENGEDAEAYLKEEARLYKAKGPPPPKGQFSSLSQGGSTDHYEYESTSEHDPAQLDLTMEVAPLNDENYPSLGAAPNDPMQLQSTPNGKRRQKLASQKDLKKKGGFDPSVSGSAALDDSPERKKSGLPLQLVPDDDIYITPYDVGYNFVPRYNGLFDPFGDSKLVEALLASAAAAARAEKPAGPPSHVESDTSPNRKSRYERLFDVPEGAVQTGQTAQSANQSLAANANPAMFASSDRESAAGNRWSETTAGLRGGSVATTARPSAYSDNQQRHPDAYEQEIHNQLKMQQYQQVLQQQSQQYPQDFSRINAGESSSYTSNVEAFDRHQMPHFLKDPTPASNGEQPQPTPPLNSKNAQHPKSASIPTPSPAPDTSVDPGAGLDETINTPVETPASSKTAPAPRRVLTIVSKKNPETPPAQPDPPGQLAEAKKRDPKPKPSDTPRDDKPRPEVPADPPLPIPEDVGPILSRKTKKKKNNFPPKLPVVRQAKPKDTAPENTPASSDQAPHEPALAEAPHPETVSMVDSAESLGNDETRVDPSVMAPVFLQVMEKSGVLIAQLEELNADGSLHLRIAALPNPDQLTVIIDGINRLCGPICNLSKFSNLDALASATWHPQSEIAQTVLSFLGHALTSIIAVTDQLVLGLETKIASIAASGKKKKKGLSAWHRHLAVVKELRSVAEQSYQARPAGPVEAAAAREHGGMDLDLAAPTPAVDSPAVDSQAPSCHEPEQSLQEPALSSDQYLEQLLTAVHDFVYLAEVRHDQPGSTKRKRKGKSLLPENPEPWVALAAATGLDPTRFNRDQQKFLVGCIQKEFPDPRVLVALIIENPNDPRLNFDHFLKNVEVPLPSRIAILEQQLLFNRIAERKLQSKLHGIQRRNNLWKPSVMAYLGVSPLARMGSPATASDEWEDTEDGDWVSEFDDVD